MSALCRRLLAVVFVFAIAPAALLRAQDAGARDPLIVPRPSLRLSPSRNSEAAAISLPSGVHLTPAIPHQSAFLFERLVRTAGIIFSGRVTSIGPAKIPSPETPGSTSVTFRVEHAIRGVARNHELTIHEWAGLWQRGERYRLGERVLLFLYPPGKLGLTSTVSGPMGRFEIDSGGNVVMNPQLGQVLSKDPSLGGRATVPYRDFALAVERVSSEGDAP